jgi:ATP-dependent exoDNAse (exonuclease V) beta subunit
LSYIGHLDDADREEAVGRALAQTKLRFPREDQWDEYVEKLRELITREDMQRFFHCPDGQVLTEQEMVTASGQSKRCDRLLIFKDEVWVIDYKSTVDAREQDALQVREYKDILKGIYPRRTIRGFLLYLDQFQIEEV